MPDKICDSRVSQFFKCVHCLRFQKRRQFCEIKSTCGRACTKWLLRSRTSKESRAPMFRCSTWLCARARQIRERVWPTSKGVQILALQEFSFCCWDYCYCSVSMFTLNVDHGCLSIEIISMKSFFSPELKLS